MYIYDIQSGLMHKNLPKITHHLTWCQLRTTWYYMQSHIIIIIFQVILGQVLIMIAMTLVSLLVQSPSVPSMVHLWLAICQVETKNQRP